MYFMFSSFQPFRPLSLQQSIYFFLFVCWQDLLEAVKPILDEDVQEAVESLLMDSAAYDAKNLYNATKVRNTRISYSVQVFAIRWFYQEVYFLLSLNLAKDIQFAHRIRGDEASVDYWFLAKQTALLGSTE